MPNLHIIPFKEKWAVLTEGKSIPHRICEFKAEAFEIARKVAIRQSTAVYIHDESGEVEFTRNYML